MSEVFDDAPDDPIVVLREWYEHAKEQGVAEPGVMALATVDAAGRSSSRMVHTLAVDAAGLLFTSHDNSVKGRDIAAGKWASAVLYWRELGRQVCVAGPAAAVSDAESQALWQARPVATHPMSVASRQSAPLDDEEMLRKTALSLTGQGPLPRPGGWRGYRLVPSSVEFWQSGADRLHRRLRYQLTGGAWTSQRLQP